MPIMTRREEDILDKLISLANGDPRLVERAFKECSKKGQEKGQEPDLKDIVSYIQDNLPESRTHAA